MLKEEGGGGQFPLPPPLHPSQQQPPPPPIGHVFFSGLNEPCAVDSIVEIVVNTTTSSGNEETINSGNVQIYVTSPQGLKRNCEVIHRGNAFTTTFTPERIGKWLIGILYEGSHIEGSPFNCFVFDAGLVHVSGLDVGLVGHELKFTIDAARAGKGNIKVLSSINGRLIDTLIIEEPPNSGVYRAKLEPKGPGKYKIQIDFNNRPVNGSPFILDIAGTDDGNGGNLISVYGDQLQMATVGKLAKFFIHAPNIELKQISSILTTPSGIKRHGNILPLDGTTFKVEWNPNETGEHLIDIFIFDRPIPENPFSCQVGDPELVSVKRMPQQIENRNLNKPHAFEIDATAAGSGNLEIIINNGRVACRVHETTSRHFIAEFTPIQEIRHIVEMKFNGEHVRDSPWSIPFISTLEGLSTIKEQNLVSQQLRANEKEDIITELIGSGLDRSIVGELSYFDIRSNIRLRTTNVSVKIVDIETGYPIENIFLIERGPGTVRCEYTLNKVGDYEVFVYIDERLIDVNQLIISAFNPKNIFVKLQGIEEDYIIGKPIYFIVDASEAGKGQLEISVNQGQVPNNVQMQDAGRCLVTFIPQHAGTYVIDVTFNGLQVHGCPIKVDVRERQVGKPVSAPVYAHPTTTSNISPSPTRGPSSSAYFSSTSPHAAASPSYTAAAASPSSTPPQIPRSPPLVAGVEAALLGGYTVAQYGNGGGGSGIPPSIKPKTISSPLSTPPTTHQKPKLFEEKEIPIINRPSIPESAQLEMTRSAEMTLFRDIPKTLVTTPIEEKEGKGREIPIQHSFNKISDQKSKELIKITNKAYDLPYAPLDQNIKKTLELIQKQQKIENIREKEETIITREQQYISSSAISPISTESISTQQIQTHIVDPYSSDIEAMTPGTRRRLLEHSVYRASDLKETPTDHEESETAISSKQSSKATTPKLSLKFRGSKDKVSSIIHPTTTMTTTTTTATISGANDIFDWGKSKINSKHEVVRRGKEVDVRIDSLKLGKEDQLYIIVLPPGIVVRPNELPTSEQSLPHKLKKSGTKNWEINFRPSVVGTHKVYIFVNTIPHPQSPFPIRVYDASQIVVGDIVRQSVVNDTVEFTVDAGRAGFGNLEMAIKDNEGIIIPSHVSQLEAGAAKFLVTFTPNLPGTHTVHITFNKEVINGSPFEVNIVEHPIVGQDSQISKKKKKDKKSKEKHSLNGTQKSIETTTSTQQQQLTNNKPMVSKLPSLSRVGQPVELLVNLVRSDDLVQAQIYDLDKELLNVEIIPDISNNNCKLIFIPKRVGDHEVEIRVAGTEIEGSPFTCRIYDPTKILVGEIPNGSINKPVSFVVDASQAGVGNLEVAVNEGKIPSMAYALGQHKYEITFIPKEEIDHRISVRFNNEYVPGSPFICRLTNSLQQQQQPLQQKQLSPPIKHRQFGASGPGLERIPVGQPTEFFVDVKPEGGETKTFDLLPRVQIMDPRGELLPIDVAAYEEEPTRSIVRYTPKSVGNHQIFIKLNNQQIPGSPFTAKVFDASCVKLALEGEGGQVGRPCAFTIDAAKAGAGNMEIIVSVDKRNVPNYVQPEGQARFRVTFTPQEAIEHLINVNFNGIPVPGSPLYCPIQPSSSIQRSSRHINNSDSEQQLPIQKQELLVIQPPTSIESKDEEEKEEKELKLVGDLSNAIIDEPKRFSIDTPTNIGRKVECNVIVVDPQGSPLPVRCYKQQDDSYWVEFTPEHCGPHRIEITFGDEPLVGSPFLCEVIDPKKVYVHGIDRPFSLRTLSNFIIDRKTAGDGTLNVELIDPQNESLKLDKIKNSVGDDSFTFLPTRLGIHRLSVRLAGFSIPSSPFQIIVEEQKTSPTVYGAALDYAIEKSQQASMIFDANKQPGGLKIDIKSPSDEKVRYTTNRRPDETTEIAFRPQEVGIYKVNIEFNNRIVNGSPFNVLVIDPTKILIIPSDDQRKNTRQDGMIQLNVGQQNIIELDATNAGPAKIKAEVRDADGELLPNKQQIQVQPSNNGNYQLLFNPRKIGKYKIYLYCSELVVPNAYPLLVYAEQILTKIQTEIPEMNGERQRKYKEVIEEVIDNEIIEKKELLINGNVKLRGSGLTTARIKEQSEFIIDASELKKELMGKCTATLLGDRADIPIKLSALGNQIFKGIYTPLVEGKYQLSVKIDGNHVPGSPSTVNVKAPEISPSQLIEVDGRPLKMGILGEDMQTLIDARKAGPGQISAQCSGLSQLEYCELLDNGDGTYMLRIQPKELGKHTLSVKYDNEHVKESPFTFNVNHPPDPSKVKVYGPGIEHGILHSFNSNFVVETKGAGAGQLTVRVRGPKGAFNVEMQRDREQERTIHCKYEPREPGDYQVEVKWHGQHVPGSPFFVLIVDTEQELHRFLAGGIPSPTPTSPFVPPGWLPPGPPGIIPGPIPGGAPPMPIMSSPMPPPHFIKGNRISPGGIPPPPPTHSIFQQQQYVRGYGQQHPPQHPHQPIYGKPHY